MSTKGFTAMLQAIERAMPSWVNFDDPRMQLREIRDKRDAASKAQQLLDRDIMARFIAQGDWDDVLKRLEDVGKLTNLLWNQVPMYGDMAILFANQLDKRSFSKQMFDLLHGADDPAFRFERYLAYIEEHALPNKWTFPTYFLFLVHPETEFFVKPSATQWFLQQVGDDTPWEGQPSAQLYQTIKEHARAFGEFLRAYNPSDMIDLQSAIYLAKVEMERMREIKVWWVNQGFTYRAAREGGFLWAPLLNKAGRSEYHWENMAGVRPGDLVLHYSNNAVRAVSKVIEAATLRPCPPEIQTGQWQAEGRYVKTDYTHFEQPIPIENIIRHEEVRAIPRGPINARGTVKQGYLFPFTIEALSKVVASTAVNWPDDVRTAVEMWSSAAPTLEHSGIQEGVFKGDESFRRAVRISVNLPQWNRLLDEGYVSVAWGEVGNLQQYGAKEDILQAINEHFAERYPLDRQREAVAEQLWLLRSLQPGDKVIATQGDAAILAVGSVQEPGYVWHEQQDAHTVAVEWDVSVAKRLPRRHAWRSVRVEEADAKLTELASAPGPNLSQPNIDLSAVCEQFGAALQASHIRFGARHDEVVRSLVVSLATKRFVILTGLSGSGKTQIALRFGEWLGEGRSMKVAVRPDWTGPEALFGYEDALQEPKQGRRSWHVPEPLKFMLKAAQDPEHPYLLVLDEMNLAHVERYFADFLSGMESEQPVLPNLKRGDDGRWWPDADGPDRIAIPDNLFVVGTVNVDETTYMFSPKVLDRANTIEFRVDSDDLSEVVRRPVPIEPGDPELVRGFLFIATDDDWHITVSSIDLSRFTEYLRKLHRLLADSHVQFGHRVVYEANRFAALLASAGVSDLMVALDLQVLQKVLPRVHGSRKRLDPVMRALGWFCFDPDADDSKEAVEAFNFKQLPEGEPTLPRTFRKLQRMMRHLEADQFASFAE